MSDARLNAMREIIQEDVGQRGLRTDPADNLISATEGDFAAACRGIADTRDAAIAVVTGFFIPHAQPPAGETDGPLGALFLARALQPLGIKVVVATDGFCMSALQSGLAACGLRKSVPLISLPNTHVTGTLSGAEFWQQFAEKAGPLSHLVALERVGPSHSPETLQASGADAATQQRFRDEVPADQHDRCHTMRGRDITSMMSPAHLLFEAATRSEKGVWNPEERFQTPFSGRIATIGIGDGGNEIGMGKLPWDLIRRNIAGGGLVACRVPTDSLIVCGISNWGAYGLAAGVRLLRGAADSALFDVERERELLEIMVERGPLVDGMSGQMAVSVDGLEFERYAEALTRIAAV
jgi:hypothetical protein